MKKYKVGTLLFGNDGYYYVAVRTTSDPCRNCIFNTGNKCRMYDVLKIRSCTIQVEGAFKYVKLKGGL